MSARPAAVGVIQLILGSILWGVLMAAGLAVLSLGLRVREPWIQFPAAALTATILLRAVRVRSLYEGFASWGDQPVRWVAMQVLTWAVVAAVLWFFRGSM